MSIKAILSGAMASSRVAAQDVKRTLIEAQKVLDGIKASKLSTHPRFNDSSILYNPRNRRD